jgi:hypothetical protein
MNGDNRLHLGVICRQSVEEADFCLGCMRERLHRTLGPDASSLQRLYTASHGLGARAGLVVRRAVVLDLASVAHRILEWLGPIPLPGPETQNQTPRTNPTQQHCPLTQLNNTAAGRLLPTRGSCPGSPGRTRSWPCAVFRVSGATAVAGAGRSEQAATATAA